MKVRSNSFKFSLADARRWAHIWLRHEVKYMETRSALTPQDAVMLQKEGKHRVTIEKSPTRCFPDSDFEKLGCEMADTGSWENKAPKDAYILGIKELPEKPASLAHRHIFFAHCYKYQRGWRNTLQRFARGGGELLDLEFLVDEEGVRVAAFSYMAGVSGAAISMTQWIYGNLHQSSPLLHGPVRPWSSREEAAKSIAAELQKIARPGEKQRTIRALIVGAKGRSGRGTGDMLDLMESNIPTNAPVQLQTVRWGREETKDGGPFWSILEYDLVFNCVFVNSPMRPLLTADMLQVPYSKRKLSVLGDVSCDVTSAFNPFPFSDTTTTMSDPTRRVQSRYFKQDQENMDVIAIDHLPALLPRDSSEFFSKALLPHLLKLDATPVWSRARVIFQKKVKEALELE